VEVQTRSKGKIVVLGIMFWFPLAGVTYQFLHYLIGLRRLGYDPYYIEDAEHYVYDPRINAVSPDADYNIERIAPILEAHGFAGKWAFRGGYEGGRCYGMTEQEIRRLYREADALLNVTGAHVLREEHFACPRRIYVESDPVADQIRVAQGDNDVVARLAAHDTLFSFGENLGAPDCGVPIEQFTWLPTRQPVVLDLWENDFDVRKGAYTTIATWRNEGKDITYRGETYRWSKHWEFLKVVDLPTRRSVPFELATGVEADDLALLQKNGWQQRLSLSVSTDLDTYRDYIQRSRAEFTVAKDQYVRLRSGWFSDRSVCYLAAGRPVITQETGFSKFLPTGEGLFGFETVDDVVVAVDTIESDYDRCSRGARAVASECFAAERVIGSLMERAQLA
jgi:hypothetical protein